MIKVTHAKRSVQLTELTWPDDSAHPSATRCNCKHAQVLGIQWKDSLICARFYADLKDSSKKKLQKGAHPRELRQAL